MKIDSVTECKFDAVFVKDAYYRRYRRYSNVDWTIVNGTLECSVRKETLIELEKAYQDYKKGK